MKSKNNVVRLVEEPEEERDWKSLLNMIIRRQAELDKKLHLLIVAVSAGE